MVVLLSTLGTPPTAYAVGQVVQGFLGAYLATHQFQVQNFVLLWRVVRVDGVTEFYTSADEDLIVPYIGNDGTYGSATFLASHGIDMSAAQKETGLRSENVTVAGVIGGINLTYLEGGRYDFAEVTEWMVDSRWPGMPWLSERQFRISTVDYSGEQWRFLLEGHGQRVRESYGHPFCATCIWSLGRDDKGNPNAGCGRDRTAVGGVKIDIADYQWQWCGVSHVAYGGGTLSPRMTFHVYRHIATAVADGAWGTPAGAVVTITSAGGNLPAIGALEFFQILDHSNPANSGKYRESGGSPTTSSITATMLDGTPVAAAAEAVTVRTSQPLLKGLPTSFLLGRPYRYGRLTWLSGANAGLSYEIADYDETISPGSTFSGQISLHRYAENEIQVGDGCLIEEGCDGTFETCHSLYQNTQNFAGRGVLAPGPTKARQAPSVTWRP
jgi:hypothetical protein